MSGDYGPPPRHTVPSRWAYRVYDCVQTSRTGFDPIDVLVIDGLNGRLTSDAVASIMLMRAELAECFDRLDGMPTAPFWEQKVDDLGPPTTEETQIWWMYRAWWLLRSAVGSNVARTHKILHHKRPDLFPLLDRLTIAELEGEEWTAVRKDLDDPTILDLSGWFEDQRRAVFWATSPLLPTRIHDILLWLHCSGDWDAAVKAGREFQ